MVSGVLFRLCKRVNINTASLTLACCATLASVRGNDFGRGRGKAIWPHPLPNPRCAKLTVNMANVWDDNTSRGSPKDISKWPLSC